VVPDVREGKQLFLQRRASSGVGGVSAPLTFPPFTSFTALWISEAVAAAWPAYLTLIDLADLAEHRRELQLADLDFGVHAGWIGDRDLQGPGAAEPEVAVTGS